MKLWLFLWALGLTTSGLAARPLMAQSLPVRIILLDSPPWIMENAPEERKGYTYELFQKVFLRAGLPFYPEYLPLARAEAETRRDPQAVCLQLSRIPSREKEYQWVIKVVSSPLVFVTPRGTAPLGSYAEASEKGRVAVRQLSAQETDLKENGVVSIESAQDDYAALRLLSAGRVVSWFTMKTRVQEVILKENLDPLQFQWGPPVAQLELYLVAHPLFPLETIHTLRQAYQETLKTPFHRQLIKKYKIVEE